MQVGRCRQSVLDYFIEYTRRKSGYTSNNNVSSYLAEPSKHVIKLRKQLKKLSENVEKIKAEAKNFRSKATYNRYAVKSNKKLFLVAQANLNYRSVLKHIR